MLARFPRRRRLRPGAPPRPTPCAHRLASPAQVAYRTRLEASGLHSNEGLLSSLRRKMFLDSVLKGLHIKLVPYRAKHVFGRALLPLAADRSLKPWGPSHRALAPLAGSASPGERRRGWAAIRPVPTVCSSPSPAGATSSSRREITLSNYNDMYICIHNPTTTGTISVSKKKV